MMIFKQSWWLAISSLAIIVQLIATKTSECVDIEGKSFSIISRVFSFANDRKPPIYKGQFNEFYSAEQKRAKIEFKLTAVNNSEHLLDPSFFYERKGTWFVDEQQRVALEFDQEQWKCFTTSIEAIQDSFNFLIPGVTLTSDDDTNPSPIDYYLIGPARMLFFIENNRAKLVATTPRDPAHNLIRNLRCIEYEFIHSTSEPGGERLEFHVYYSEIVTSFGGTGQVGQYPVRIAMYNRGKQSLTIDYMQIEQLSSSSAVGLSLQNNHHNLVSFDPFIIRPITGCSIAVATADQNNQLDLFSSGKMLTNQTKFSFESVVEGSEETKSPINGERKSFLVAYDSALGSMRVDQHLEVLDNSNITWYKSRERKLAVFESQVFDFKLNRRYHAVNSERLVDRQTTSSILDLKRVEEDYFAGKKCVATKLMKSTSTSLSVGQLLAGADKFIYLGRAKVRGIGAKVYEAFHASMPFWLEQPIVYLENSTEYELHRSGLQSELEKDNKLSKNGKHNFKTPTKLTNRNVLLYFGDEKFHNPLLLIQVFTMDSESSKVLNSKSIHVYDFIWQLTKSSNGDNEMELLSLPDSCIDSNGARAKFELAMESAGSSSSGSILEESPIFSSNLRNIALLASLQEKLHFEHLTVILNLESKLFTGDKSQKQQKDIIKLAASFQVAESTKSLLKFIHLGRGRPKNPDPSSKGNLITVAHLSLEDCFSLAAHDKYDEIYFGYNFDTANCFVIGVGPVAVDQRSVVELNSSVGSFEIFRTEYHPARGSDYSRWFKQDLADGSKILGSHLRLRAANGPQDDMVFTIRSFKKEFENPSADVNGTSKETPGGLSLTGFGLLETGEGNRRIEPASFESHNLSPLSHEWSVEKQESTMSFDQCHAACLADFKCKSFSVCVEGSQIGCVISKWTFEIRFVLEQVKNSTGSGKRTKSGQKFLVLPQTTSFARELVEIFRHPNCEIRNKDLLELFTDRVDIRQNLRNRFARAVANQAECAERCFMKNVQVLEQDADKMRQLFLTVSDKKRSSPNIATNLDDFNSMLKDHRQAMNQLCTEFFYLNLQQLSVLESSNPNLLIEESPLMVKDQQGMVIIMDRVGGFCLEEMSEANLSEIIQKIDNVDRILNTRLDIEFYRFKTEIFYEKHSGVGIKDSSLSREEFSAYQQVSQTSWTKQQQDNAKKQANETAFKIVKDLIGRGADFQQFVFGNPSDCAKACFKQSAGPWPACRSFDVLQADKLTWCRLHSVTWRQAIETTRKGIENQTMTEGDSIIWHYEPRAGFLVSEAFISGEIEIGGGELYVDSSDSSAAYYSAMSELRIKSAFVLFLIVVMGLVAGVFLGARLHQFMSSKCNPSLDQHSSPTKNLVRLERTLPN